MVWLRRDSGPNSQHFSIVQIVCFFYLPTFVTCKELPLPDCQDIPGILCNEERIKDVCGRCGIFPGKPRQTVSTAEPLQKTTIAFKWLSVATDRVTGPGANKVQESNQELKKEAGSSNESVRKFIAPPPRQSGPDSVDFTLSPETEEEIREFFEQPARTKAVLTTSTPSPLNRTCDKIHACVDLAEANRRFLQRCQRSQPPISGNCHGFCRYDVSLPELRNAFVRGTCPTANVRLYLNAASALRDNTRCCSSTQVLEGRRNICFPFCNPNGPIWPDRKDSLKYLPCLQSLEQIMRCHWAGLE